MRVVVVMGVSGAGKTTVARILARRLQWDFTDADSFHPAENVERMAKGQALSDEDRYPWLQAIASWIDATRRSGRGGIIACSALKRKYRDVIIGSRPDVQLLYLKATSEVIRDRLANRPGHFFPSSLLDSQFKALEEPSEDENAIVVSVEAAPGAIAEHLIRMLA